MNPIDPNSCDDTVIEIHLEKKQKTLEKHLKNFCPGSCLVSTRNKNCNIQTSSGKEERK